MQNPTSIKRDIEYLFFQLSCCISDLSSLWQYLSEEELNQSLHLANQLQLLNKSNNSFIQTYINH